MRDIRLTSRVSARAARGSRSGLGRHASARGERLLAVLAGAWGSAIGPTNRWRGRRLHAVDLLLKAFEAVLCGVDAVPEVLEVAAVPAGAASERLDVALSDLDLGLDLREGPGGVVTTRREAARHRCRRSCRRELDVELLPEDDDLVLEAREGLGDGLALLRARGVEVHEVEGRLLLVLLEVIDLRVDVAEPLLQDRGHHGLQVLVEDRLNQLLDVVELARHALRVPVHLVD